MQFVRFYACDPTSGATLPGASVSVFPKGSTSLAILYAEDGQTALTNPVRADNQGRYGFSAANGDYSVVITPTGGAAQAAQLLYLFDPDDAEGGGGTVTAVPGDASFGDGGETVAGALAALAAAQAAVDQLNQEIDAAEAANADVSAALATVQTNLTAAQQTLGAAIAQAQADATTVALTALNDSVSQFQQNQSIKATTTMPDGTAVNFGLTKEITFRVQGDAANAEQISGLSVTVGDQGASIGDLQVVTVDLQAQKADASDLEELQTSYDGFSSSVSLFEESTTSSLSAQASTLTDLETDYGDVQASVTQEATARAQGDEALTATQETQAGQIDDNTSSITDLSDTVTTDQSSQTQLNETFSSDIGGLQDTTGAQGGDITDLQATASEQAGTLATLAGKLLAYFDFTAAAGGNSAEVRIAADNNTSAIQLIAQVLSIASDQGGGTPIPVLVATAGVVGIMTKLLIGSSLLLDPTTGTIYLSLGSVALALGGPFGANGDLAFWMGPAMALSSMTKANARFYLDTSADAYFGGSISAGKLCNSQQGTDTSATAQTVLGPFGSNGDQIVIACSYSYTRNGQRASGGSTSVSGSPSATVTLYQTIGTGSETAVASQNVSGQASGQDTGDGYWIMNESMSGSFTYTDNADTTQTRTYRLAVSNRTTASFNGGSYNGAVDHVAQSIGIVSSEN